jgi:hypothetical protein
MESKPLADEVVWKIRNTVLGLIVIFLGGLGAIAINAFGVLPDARKDAILERVWPRSMAARPIDTKHQAGIVPDPGNLSASSVKRDATDRLGQVAKSTANAADEKIQSVRRRDRTKDSSSSTHIQQKDQFVSNSGPIIATDDGIAIGSVGNYYNVEE